MPTKYEMQIKYLSNAANRFLCNMIKAIRKSGNEVRVFSYIGFPLEEEIKGRLMDEKNAEMTFVFKTRFFVKGFFDCLAGIRKEIRQCEMIIIYNADYIWFAVPLMAKILKKQSILILADYSDKHSYTNIFRKIYASLQLRFIRSFGKVVGLSEDTRRFLRKSQYFLCVEGGIDSDVYQYFEKDSIKNNDKGEVRFMYSGLLEPVTGIDMLLEAFINLDSKNAKLYVSGKGRLKDLVIDCAKKDSRIIYLGCLEYAEYLQNLEASDVLINPRNMNLPENKNNFPSKIMEYLATGKYIISTRFPGWRKFEDNIFFCDSNIKAIECAISGYMNFSEVDKEVIYQSNRELAKKYLWDRQIDRIINAESWLWNGR